MNLQGRHLLRDMEPRTGDDVALLQRELQQLGFDISEKERNERFFDDSTHEAVVMFQEMHDLVPNGIVDEGTAAMINRMVDGDGEQPPPAKPFVVNGRVVHVDGRSFAGGLVRAFDKDLRSEEELGDEVPTDAQGRYEIRYGPEDFSRVEKDSADLIVRAYNADKRELGSSPILFNAGTEETIDLVLGEGVYRGPSEYEQLEEELTPLLQGLPFAELTEDEKHQDVTFLSAETGQDPERIVFLIVAHRLMQQTDLPAEVFYGFFRQNLPTNLPALLAQAPEVQRRALETAARENTIPARFGDEIDEILERLKQLIVRQAFEQPAEDGKTSLTALLGTTLEDEKRHEEFLSAYVNHTGPIEKFWEDLRAKPEFADRVDDLQFTLQLGALTRNHLPLVQELQRDPEISTLRDLVRYDEAGWEGVLSRPGVGLPPDGPGTSDEKPHNYARAMAHLVEDAFPTAFVAHRLEDEQTEGEEHLRAFFKGNEHFDLTTTRLESHLAENPAALDDIAPEESEERAGLKLQIETMQRLHKVAPRYAQMRPLMEDGLGSARAITRMGPTVFMREYAETLGGQTEAKRVYENAEQAAATAVVLLGEYGMASRRTSTEAVPDGTPEQVEGIPDWPTLFGSLDLCECEHCRSVYSPAAYLVDVLHFLKDRQLVDMDASTRDENGKITNVVYRQKTLPEGSQVAKSAKDTLFERRPDLGEIELTCENTNTPVPYVDLVNEVLENYVAPFDPFTPFDLAAELESDLDNRKLSTSLKDAFIPQLSEHAVVTVKKRGEWWSIDDLAFTYTVRKDKEGTQPHVTARGLQTGGTPQERAANAQYVNPNAYDKVRQQVFPSQLPFDLWWEEARAYLEHMGVQCHQIMETFLPGDRAALLANVDIAREHLGLNADEAKLVTGATTSQPGIASPGVWNLWGFNQENLDAANAVPDPADSTEWLASGNWLDVLTGRVDVFLQQSGLRYKELLDMLTTDYINPLTGSGQLTINIDSTDASSKDTCELNKLELVGLDETTGVRISRFVRLWRKLGWSMRDLDKAFAALKPTDPNDEFLVQLSHVKRLNEELNVPVDKLLSFWAPIDTVTYIDHQADGQPRLPSLYAHLFRNKAVTNPLDPSFTEDTAGLSGKLSEHAATIAAALGISADDFSLLFGDADIIPRDTGDPSKPKDQLQLDHLSRLHRHATLAKALRLPVRDYLSALKLNGGTPFATTADTVLFVERIDKIRASGFSIAELDYLLRHELVASASVAPADEEIATVLDDLRTGLQKIVAENTFVEDPTDPNGVTSDPKGDLTSQKLSLLNWNSASIEQAVATLNDAVTYRAPLPILQPGVDLPNDTGAYEVNLAALPAGFAFPAELRDVVKHEGTFLFAADSHFASELNGGHLSNDLRKLFANHSVTLSASANAIAQAPGERWQVDDGGKRYSILKKDSLLAVYNETDKKLKASRILIALERETLRNASKNQTYQSALRTLFLLQDELQGKLTYDPIGQELLFTGAMTKVRRQKLESASADAGYRGAIKELFEAPRTFISREMRTFSVPDFSQTLAVLPATIKDGNFPSALKSRVYYDVAAKKLHFLGTMAESERDALLALSVDPNDPGRPDPNDPASAPYRSAVNELFKAPEAHSPEPEDVFLTASGTDDDAEALFDDPTIPAERFELVLKKLMPYLRRTLSERLVTQKLGEALKLETRTTEGLLTKWVNAPTDSAQKSIAVFLDASFAESNPNVTLNRSAFGDQYDTFTLLHKIALIASKFEVTPRQLGWVFDHGQDVGWLNLNALLPLAANSPPTAILQAWERLLDLFRLRDALPEGEALLDDLFSVAHAVSPTAQDDAKNHAKQKYIETLSAMTRWPEESLEVLVGQKDDHTNKGMLEATFPADFKDERLLSYLHGALALSKRLGMSVDTCRDLSNPEVTEETARSVRQAVRAKYDEAQWLQVAQPLRDVLREKQRAALVAYLVTHPDASHRWRDVNDVYSHFLIDVEMGPCQMTSRIKQAISSVQLFVQRCLMNLEEEVVASAEVDVRWLEWKWMKNYRVWEANRKVFLYPENWIEPELRDDKSPFFKELEDELLQSDLTEETAETAFLNYLEKLDQVGRLEIIGMYHQEETDTSGNKAVDVLHVFGRTHATPHVYYYRKRVDSAYWTAWEKVDVDIEGDHLIPVVWNRRLYLFWPIFTKKQEEKPVNMPESGKSVEQGARYWQIQIAWSAYKNQGWSAKKITPTSIRSDLQPDEFDLDDQGRSRHVFRDALGEEGDFLIWYMDGTLEPDPPDSTVDYGASVNDRPDPDGFRFISSSGEVLAGKMGSGKGLERPTGTKPDGMVFVEATNNDLYLPGNNSTGSDVKVLDETPGNRPFRILYPNQDGRLTAQRPFFFQDTTKTFFIVPEEAFQGPELLVSERIEPRIVDRIYEVYKEKPKLALAPDLVGPVVNPADPVIFEPSFPIQSRFDSPFNTTVSVGSIVAPNTMMRSADGETAGLETRTMMGSSANGIGATVISRDASDILKRVTSSPATLSVYWTDKRYLFQTFYHPYVLSFVRHLNRDGTDGLFQRPVQLVSRDYFGADYGPTDAVIKTDPVYGVRYPREDVDFSYGGAYARYNWELFFHVPFMIADRLSKNQRFEEAQKWFHYVFDPTDTSSLPVPQRYWRTRPFYETTDEKYQKENIPNLLRFLAKRGDPEELAKLTPKLREELEELEDKVREWRKNPFKPHLVARTRTTAYQKTVVMKYLDNLVAWGDQLFRRDTMESINEATQLYILAAELLGKRPEEIPPRAIAEIQTYNSLEPSLDEFSEALVKIEEFVPPSAGSGTVTTSTQPPLTLPTMLYFCVPKNEKLLGYWDTVADRLFKIRHCMNIEGVVRQLPLFEPPIDPALLVKAVAAGIDISSALNDINAALPHYRFNVMSQKASELCAELKALGGALLSTLERRDAEALALLRSTHEIKVLDAVRLVKEQQIAEANETLAGLQEAKTVIEARQAYTSSREYINLFEAGQLLFPALSLLPMLGQMGAEIAAGTLHLIPEAKVGTPTTIGVTYGGANIASALQAFGSALGTDASMLNTAASLSATMAVFDRRWDEWGHQTDVASKELKQVEKQIAAAAIRKAIAEQELKNHDKQVESAKEVDAFMRGKFTNRELYDWMVGQISGIYFQSYQLAYDVAKRAERAYRHELGLQESNFVQFGYWDSLKKGLLAGERLYHDLKRMEVAYLDQNRREYEITKHVSLAQLAPVALEQLKQTGECFVNVPEALFDLAQPGHYMRRIKSVGVTIPCVTGPFTGVNCTLTLLKSSVRQSNTLAGGKYSRQDSDPRFTDSIGAVQSIVTSSGQNDSGLFEPNLHDERYLPFEGAGVDSDWHIELPKEFRQFDYDTISDVVLHVRYTAREGGGLLKQRAISELQTAINEIITAENEKGFARLFSLGHELPSEYRRFLEGTAGEQTLTLPLAKDRFPYLLHSRTIQVNRVEMLIKLSGEFAVTDGSGTTFTLTFPDESTAITFDLSAASKLGDLLRVAKDLPKDQEVPSDPENAAWTLKVMSVASGLEDSGRLNPDAIEDIGIIVHYALA
jgi:hypothetical protein